MDCWEGGVVEGLTFGRYRPLSLIGRGDTGEVWRAHDTATDRVVAIKLFPEQYSSDSVFQERFRRQAHAAARLNSPHVVPIHDYGEIGGRLYVSMRLVEGRDLQTVLTDGPLQPSRAVRIIEQVAKALHAAHQAGLVHREVKPAKILLGDDDFAYLIDCGIARATDDTRLTGTGNGIRTYQYTAPERLGDSPDDARADTYALACVLYECLTGQPPFAGTEVPGLIAAHLHTPPPRPSVTRSDVPQSFDAVIAIGMAKDPRLRYATAIELSTAATEAVSVVPAPPTEPRAEPQPNALREGDWVSLMSPGSLSDGRPWRINSLPRGADRVRLRLRSDPRLSAFSADQLEGIAALPDPSTVPTQAGPPVIVPQTPNHTDPDPSATVVQPQPQDQPAVLREGGWVKVVRPGSRSGDRIGQIDSFVFGTDRIRLRLQGEARLAVFTTDDLEPIPGPPNRSKQPRRGPVNARAAPSNRAEPDQAIRSRGLQERAWVKVVCPGTWSDGRVGQIDSFVRNSDRVKVRFPSQGRLSVFPATQLEPVPAPPDPQEGMRRSSSRS
jgi:serine/threonine protein kinase